MGKIYQPDAKRVVIDQPHADMGGNTSVRNTDEALLQWKREGYIQRNRDLEQVFTPERDFWLEAIVLRTGPVDAEPALSDQHDRYHAGWAVRREGNGVLPPTMFSGETPSRRPKQVGKAEA